MNRKDYKHKYYLAHYEKIRQYQKEYYKKNKKKLLTYHKLRYKIRYKEEHCMRQKIMHNLKINGCAICGYNKCDRSLMFHHVNPEDKQLEVAQRILNRKNSVITTELNKCILLCCNCHGEIHTMDGD